MLQALADEKVRFLLVGAYALAAHGYPRATMDIDIWVMPSPDNADAVLRALRRFGTPLHNVTRGDFEEEGTAFQIGVAPRRIDLITTASGAAVRGCIQELHGGGHRRNRSPHSFSSRPHPQQAGIRKNQGLGRCRSLGRTRRLRTKRSRRRLMASQNSGVTSHCSVRRGSDATD